MFTLLSLYQGAVVLGTAFAADYVTFAVLRFMAGFGEAAAGGKSTQHLTSK